MPLSPANLTVFSTKTGVWPFLIGPSNLLELVLHGLGAGGEEPDIGRRGDEFEAVSGEESAILRRAAEGARHQAVLLGGRRDRGDGGLELGNLEILAEAEA